MLLLQDGIIAFLSAVGLTALVWIIGGAVLQIGRPAIPGLLLVLPVKGEALSLETDMRELRLVQGGLPGAKILLADCGLTQDAKALAEYLTRREKEAALVAAGEWKL